MRRIFILALILTLFSLAYGDDLTEYERGLIQRVKNLFGEEITVEPLPLPVCATPLMNELKFKFKNLSPETQNILKTYLSRPIITNPDTFDTPSGYFRIHYTTTGDDSVYQAQADTNGNGVPDYVDRFATVLDSVKVFEISSLGYNTPPSDFGFLDNGGDGRYDIYLKNLDPGALGYTQGEAWNPYPKATSYIVMRNDYLGYGYPDQFDLLRVTAAHEFFHAIQIGYDGTEWWTLDGEFNPYWHEISSTWMEDVAYDHINDYVGYLNYFFNYTYLSLETFSSSFPDPEAYHAYASCVWAMYLTEKHGAGIMKDIWTACGQEDSSNVIPVTDSILALKGSSYDDAFTEFTLWNWFTNTRADTLNYYSEGHLFPKIQQTVGHYHSSYPVKKDFAVLPPQQLGSNYVYFIPQASPGGLRMYFFGDSTADWRVSVIGYKSGSTPYFDEFSLDVLENGNLDFYNWQFYDQIIMIPAVVSKDTGTFNYAYADTFDPALDVEEEKEQNVPGRFDLAQNYPNPFNATTTISFTIHGEPEKENVPIHTTLTIHNILGQKIKTLVNQNEKPGTYKAYWDGRDEVGFEVSSGVYFYKLKVGDYEKVRKLVYLK